MKKLALFIASIFLLSACAGGLNWQRASGGGEAALKVDDRKCQTLANQKVLKSNPKPGGYYGIERGRKLQKRTAMYEGCMLKQGWDQTESS